MDISIVIPTYNEATNILKLVQYLLVHNKEHSIEVIVSDGGSADDTVKLANEAGAIVVVSPQKGRAAQMNYGASLAKADIFYFVHADSFPPKTFVKDILQAIQEGYALGRYQTRFDSNSPLLKCNAFFTRFDLFMCYGGDQTLFIQKKIFQAIDGFDTGMRIMEEYDLVTRARTKGRYKILKGKTLVSVRKYDNNSWLQVQKANYRMIKMYKNGASQNLMAETYKQMLKPS